jgi:ABC-type anion transport system duplicated permease subunit
MTRFRQVVRRVRRKVSAGRSTGDIRTELIQQGVPADTARALVESVVRERRKRRALKFASSWLGIIILFLLVNGALYTIQEIAAADEKREIGELERVMDDLNAEITSLEALGETSRSDRRDDS